MSGKQPVPSEANAGSAPVNDQKPAADAGAAPAAAPAKVDETPNADDAAAKAAADAAAKAAEAPADGADPKPDDKKIDDADPSKKTDDEQNPAGDKVVPDKYDLKMPEKSILSEAALEEVSALAKDLKLTNEQAQSLLEREHKAAQAGRDYLLKEAEKKSEQWLEDAKKDKDIGGDKFAETVQLANSALEKLFPGVEIRQMMDVSGLGNNPTVLKGFASIGRLLADDKIVKPGVQPAPSTKSKLERLYDHPTSQPK